MRKPEMTYKLEDCESGTAHYTHCEVEARQEFLRFIKDGYRQIRLYEAPMPVNDHDEIEWEVIDYYDAETDEYQIVLFEENVYYRSSEKGVWTHTVGNKLITDPHLTNLLNLTAERKYNPKL